MAAPTSSTDICSLAMGILKEKAVSNVAQPTKNTEVVCAKWYDTARRYTLEMHPWHFAKKRVALAQDVVSPAFGWTYQSAELPSDFIRLLSLGENEDIFDFDFEDNKLLSNDPAPYYLRYIYDIKTVTKFSPTFVLVLASHIAAFAAYEITGKDTLMKELMNFAQLQLDKAAAVSGQQKPPRRIESSNVINARRGFRRRNDAYYLGGS